MNSKTANNIRCSQSTNTTVAARNLEANQFSGTLPSELGKLVNLETLMLSSNNFSGNLPEELGGLKNLTDFCVNDNNLNGTIPDFIQNWKQLERLEMIASGFKGPIPSSISVLEKLTDLLLHVFWDQDMKICFYLVILVDKDLSFNKLSGELSTVISTESIKFIFLSGNLLSGNVPESILKKGTNVDLSYNNFKRQSAEQPACQTTDMNLNLFRSYLQESGLRAICPCKISNALDMGILYISIVVERTLEKETLYMKEMQMLTVVLQDSFQVTTITGD